MASQQPLTTLVPGGTGLGGGAQKVPWEFRKSEIGRIVTLSWADTASARNNKPTTKSKVWDSLEFTVFISISCPCEIARGARGRVVAREMVNVPHPYKRVNGKRLKSVRILS